MSGSASILHGRPGDLLGLCHSPPSRYTNPSLIAKEKEGVEAKIGALMKMLSGYYRSWDPDLVEDLLERFKLDPPDGKPIWNNPTVWSLLKMVD